MPMLILTMLFLLFGPKSAHAWGEGGHRAVSEAVQSSLDPAARNAIAQIVNGQSDLAPGALAQLSLWPDLIRPLTNNPHTSVHGFTPDELEEAKQFVKDHPDNTDWHFLDLPPASPRYPDIQHPDPHDPVAAFAPNNDVVHMIYRCIEVLEADTAPPDMTKLQALRRLIHLVEDLHQPLHVSSGYYRTTPSALAKPHMITDPAIAAKEKAKNDRGGNVLLFLKHSQCPTKPTTENLHSVWDKCLVDVVSGATGCVNPTSDELVMRLADLLEARMKTPEAQAYHTTADFHHWAEEWATYSVHVAKARVFPIQLVDGCVIKDKKAPHKPLHVQSRIATPATKKQYLLGHTEDAAVQLTKAAVRLTDLLNQIQWK
jgi:hypothetical protein